MRAVVDNDILHKAARYDLCAELVLGKNAKEDTMYLGAARFVLPAQFAKISGAGSTLLCARLTELLSELQAIEPTDSEIQLAGEFEAAALSSDLALDSGESQLCAVVLHRSLDLMITGDNRAIYALELLYSICPQLVGLRGKVKCLEQCVLDLLTDPDNYDHVRRAICAASDADKTLSICFRCLTNLADHGETWDCLCSYIKSLRVSAPHILCD